MPPGSGLVRFSKKLSPVIAQNLQRSSLSAVLLRHHFFRLLATTASLSFRPPRRTTRSYLRLSQSPLALPFRIRRLYCHLHRLLSAFLSFSSSCRRLSLLSATVELASRRFLQSRQRAFFSALVVPSSPPPPSPFPPSSSPEFRISRIILRRYFPLAYDTDSCLSLPTRLSGPDLPLHDRKQLAGECLFSCFQPVLGTLSGKIVGMILEYDMSELIVILREPSLLADTVCDALLVLHAPPPDSDAASTSTPLPPPPPDVPAPAPSRKAPSRKFDYAWADCDDDSPPSTLLAAPSSFVPPPAYHRWRLLSGFLSFSRWRLRRHFSLRVAMQFPLLLPRVYFKQKFCSLVYVGWKTHDARVRADPFCHFESGLCALACSQSMRFPILVQSSSAGWTSLSDAWDHFGNGLLDASCSADAQRVFDRLFPRPRPARDCITVHTIRTLASPGLLGDERTSFALLPLCHPLRASFSLWLSALGEETPGGGGDDDRVLSQTAVLPDVPSRADDEWEAAATDVLHLRNLLTAPPSAAPAAAVPISNPYRLLSSPSPSLDDSSSSTSSMSTTADPSNPLPPPSMPPPPARTRPAFDHSSLTLDRSAAHLHLCHCFRSFRRHARREVFLIRAARRFCLRSGFAAFRNCSRLSFHRRLAPTLPGASRAAAVTAQRHFRGYLLRSRLHSDRDFVFGFLETCGRVLFHDATLNGPPSARTPRPVCFSLNSPGSCRMLATWRWTLQRVGGRLGCRLGLRSVFRTELLRRYPQLLPHSLAARCRLLSILQFPLLLSLLQRAFRHRFYLPGSTGFCSAEADFDSLASEQYSTADRAAIEAASGLPLDDAVLHAVQVETLADSLLPVAATATSPSVPPSRAVTTLSPQQAASRIQLFVLSVPARHHHRFISWLYARRRIRSVRPAAILCQRRWRALSNHRAASRIQRFVRSLPTRFHCRFIRWLAVRQDSSSVRAAVSLCQHWWRSRSGSPRPALPPPSPSPPRPGSDAWASTFTLRSARTYIDAARTALDLFRSTGDDSYSPMACDCTLIPLLLRQIAVLTLQRHLRGYLARSYFSLWLSALGEESSGRLSFTRYVAEPAARTIQRYSRGYLTRSSWVRSHDNFYPTFHYLPPGEPGIVRSRSAADSPPPADSDAVCLRSVAGRRQTYVVTSRALAFFRILSYFYRSRRRSVPFCHHRLLLPPFRGHNPQSYTRLVRLAAAHSHCDRRPFPAGSFYRPVPLKPCGYGSAALATAADFASHRQVAAQVLSWYSCAGADLLALALGCSRFKSAFGFSGCNGFGSSLPSAPTVPVDAYLIDGTVHPAARAFFGSSRCYDGDALDLALRASLCQLPGFIANHDSPECDSYSGLGALTRRRRRAPQQIGAARAMLMSLFHQFGMPFTIEMVRGSVGISTSLACRLRAADFGLRNADSHWIETPPGYLLHCDRVLTAGGDALLSRCCTGAMNSLPSLDYFGRPFARPCCNGNIPSLHGTSPVCSLPFGAECLGIDPSLVPTWGHLVNCTPASFGLFTHYQLCSLIMDHRCHLPFVTYDSTLSCPSLLCLSEVAQSRLASRPRRHALPLPLRLLRPLWPRFDRATISVIPSLLSYSPTAPSLTSVVLCSDSAFSHCNSHRYPYSLPFVRLTPGRPLLESVCDDLLCHYGIEALAFRPYLALATPSALHFCVPLPLSDDVMRFLSSLGTDPFAASPSVKPPPIPHHFSKARRLRLVAVSAVSAVTSPTDLISATDCSVLSSVLLRATTHPAFLNPLDDRLARDLHAIPSPRLPSARRTIRRAVLRHLLRRRRLPSGHADLSFDAEFGPSFSRSPHGVVFHLDEDGVHRPVDELCFDSCPDAASCALEGSFLVTPSNSYWVDAVARKLRVLEPVASSALATAAAGPATSVADDPAVSLIAPATSEPVKVVDTLDRLFAPARLVDLEFRSNGLVSPVTANCTDSGGSLTFIGSELADQLTLDHPDCIDVVDHCQIAHRFRDHELSGVGGACLITSRVNLRFYISGRAFYVKNVAVVDRFGLGFIIGNDFHDATGAVIDFRTSEACYDHPDGRFCSRFTALRRPPVAPVHGQPPSTASVATTSSLPSRVFQSEPLASAVRPLAFASRDIKVPARCLEKVIRVKVPSSMPVGSLILLDRVREGTRPGDLNVIVAAAVARVAADRTVPLTVLNPNSYPVRIPELTVLAEFEFWEPSTASAAEYTVDQLLEMIHLGPEVRADADKMAAVRAFLARHCHVFSSTPGYTHAVTHDIPTPSLAHPHGEGTTPPPRVRVKPENAEQRAAFQKLIDKRIRSHLVTPSRSPFCSRPMLVRKADGVSWRLVVDLRALNEVTTKDHYPLPNIMDNLSKASGHWFSTADLLSGFDQVELTESSKSKTAFGTSFGLFQFERMTQGLTGAPATFQRLIDEVFRGLPSEMVLTYIDDILTKTSSTSFYDHMADLDATYTRIGQSGLTVSADKVYIGFARVAYLGYEVGREGIRPDPSRATAVLDMPPHVICSSAKKASSFLGMCGYYRTSIPHFSELASPFYELSQKGCDQRAVLSSLRILASIASLKQSLRGLILTRVPDFSRPFFVSVDGATLHGTGATLYQKDDDGNEGLIATCSHRLNETETGWSAHEVEAYGLYLAVCIAFDVYLSRCPTTVFVDHSALAWLFKSNKELHNDKVRNWVGRLQSYDLDVIARPGRDHFVPDAISRILLADAPLLHRPGTFETWPDPSLSHSLVPLLAVAGGKEVGGAGSCSHSTASDPAAVPAAAPTSLIASARPNHTKSSKLPKPKVDRFPAFPSGPPPLTPDFLLSQISPSSTRSHNKLRSRVALVLTDRHSLFCLRVGDSLHLPSGPIPTHLRRRPRVIATECFRGFFGQPSARLDALIQASAHRYGRGHTQYFIVTLPPGFPPLVDELPTDSPLSAVSSDPVSSFWLPISCPADDLSLSSPFSHCDDSELLHQILRTYRGSFPCAQQLSSVFSPSRRPSVALAFPASPSPLPPRDGDFSAVDLDPSCFAWSADLRLSRPLTRLVYKRISGSWEPWVLVTESALLRRVVTATGPPPPSLGLYACRRFRRPREPTRGISAHALVDIVGRYSGRVLGRFATRAAAQPVYHAAASSGKDKLLLVYRNLEFILLDASEQEEPPFLSFANDPHNTVPRLRSNTRVSPSGVMTVTSDIPAFDFSASTLDANLPSEMRWVYDPSDEYWDFFSLLGQQEHPVLVDFASAAPAATSLVASAAPAASALDPPVATCSDPLSPGPSYHRSAAVALAALSNITDSLSDPRNPRVIALDLEGNLKLRGSIELLQICVTAVPPSPNHVHVFDIRKVPTLLSSTTSPLRSWLQSEDVIKVIHSGRGDGLTLFSQFGIFLRGAFDTGIADSLITGRHPYSSRNLSTVLRAYLPSPALDHKDGFQHTTTTWTRRPITTRLFEYAYQDVLSCVDLYFAMLSRMATLCPLHPLTLRGLTLSLTTASQPPLSLPVSHPSVTFPSRVCFIVHDTVHCLVLRRAHALALPSFDLPAWSPPVNPYPFFRAASSAAWCDFFGSPSRGGDFRSYFHKMRRPLLLEDSFAVEVQVGCLRSVCSGMADDLPAGFPANISFEYLPMSSSFDHISDALPLAHSRCLQYLVHLRSFTSRAAVRSSATSLVTAGSPPRCHLLLHDDTHCLILRVKPPRPGVTAYSLPFFRSNSEVVSPRAAALHGLEVMLGPILRWSSAFGSVIRRSAMNGRLLSDSVDTPVYECRLDSSAFPLRGYLASFTVAWRNRRMSTTLASNVSDWLLCSLTAAASLLPPSFGAALSSASSPPSPVVPPLFSSCHLHLLVLIDTSSGPSLLLPSLPDGSLDYSFFGGPASSADSHLACLRLHLEAQIGPDSIIGPAVEHTLSVYPDGSVCYENSVCHRAWCVHVNVMAAKSVSASGSFSQVRLSDFLSDLALAADRRDYVSCCEAAVNNAIRIAYPRVIPSVPLLPPRSTRPYLAPHSIYAAASHKAPPSPLPTPPRRAIAQGPLTSSLPRSAAILLSGGAPPDPSYLCPPAFVSAASTLPSFSDQPLPFFDLACRLALSLADRLDTSSAASCRHVVSSGWLCPEVCLSISTCLLAAPCFPAEPSTAPSADPSFGSHAPFHDRPRRPSAGSTVLPRPPSLGDIITAQRTCAEFRHIYAYLLDGPAYLLASGDADPASLDSTLRSACSGYRLVDGVLVRLDVRSDVRSSSSAGYRIVLPDSLRSWALHAYHDLNGHQGVNRTVGSISRLYFWPGLHRDVEKHVRNCDACSRAKVSRMSAGEFHLAGDGDHPWDVVTVDLYYVGYDDDGFDHVLVFADQFGRAVICVAVRGTPNSRQVFEYFFLNVVRYKGYPRRVRSDRGSIFLSEFIAVAFASVRVTIEASTAGHHETVGLAERFNSTLRHLLLTSRVSTADPRWTRYLPHMEIAYNAAIHAKTGFSPFYIEHGRDFRLALDVAHHGLDSSPGLIQPYVAAFVDRLHTCWTIVRKRLFSAAVASKRLHDATHDTRLHFSVGQRVLVVKDRDTTFDGFAVTKWDEPKHGPYRVSEVLSHDNYRLSGLPSRRFHDVFHVSRLAPYPALSNPLPEDRLVDRVVSRRLIPGQPPHEASSYEYRVSWFDHSDLTWEPLRNLMNSLECVNAYTLLHPLPASLDDSTPAPPSSTPLLSLPRPSGWRSARPRPDPLPIAPPSAPSDSAEPGVLDTVLEEPEPSGAPAPAYEGPLPPSVTAESNPADDGAGPGADAPAAEFAPVDEQPAADADRRPVEWLCTSCTTLNQGGSFCSSCGLSRQLFGADSSDSRPSRPGTSAVSTSSHLSDAQLRRVYASPFRHPRGPRAYRVEPQHRDSRRSKPRPAVYFELFRQPGGWTWVYPGPRGEQLSIDEFNRVRAFRSDHPDAYPVPQR